MEERVAAAVLEAYAGLRIKDGGCWTVVAGVAAVAGDDVEVLSVASGCKCVGGPASPALVRDGHAEVLAFLRDLGAAEDRARLDAGPRPVAVC